MSSFPCVPAAASKNITGNIIFMRAQRDDTVATITAHHRHLAENGGKSLFMQNFAKFAFADKEGKEGWF